ncbi:MAG: nucleotidyltransferase family protein [Candidatus Omnitrophota bacterium]
MKSKDNKSAAPFLIPLGITVKTAMKRLSEIGAKELFVVNEQEQLAGALSDGDIRKWLLHGGKLDAVVDKVCNKTPKFVERAYDLEHVKSLMLEHKIESIPVIDGDRKVERILVWDEVFGNAMTIVRPRLKLPVVIMAGGKGTRLDPFTRILPKPLIPIGDKPVIELIMEKFAEYGTRQFLVSLNHKARMVKSYFEEARQIYKIRYVTEDRPLGTAGALRLLARMIKGVFIVTNCDIIINCDYAELAAFHAKSRNDITIVVSCRNFVIPYGVCDIEPGGILKAIQEKPGYDVLVNTGMYVVNPKLIKLIPAGVSFNFTDLISKAKGLKMKVGVFPISEDAWIDIGQWEEYQKAVRNLNQFVSG